MTTITNLQCATLVLTKHREARAWDDRLVAADLLGQLGLEPDGNASNATVADDPDVPSAEEVAAAEARAQEAMDTWTTLRHRRQQATAADDGDQQRGAANEAMSQGGIVANEQQQPGAEEAAVQQGANQQAAGEQAQ